MPLAFVSPRIVTAIMDGTAQLFTVAEDGTVVRISDAEKSVIDTILWKKTFRNVLRR
jgi:hypothetical protein